MNKKKVFGIVGGILLVLLILFLILNPAWVTHTKYMLDSKYCEQDSDCVRNSFDCNAINFLKFDFVKKFKFSKSACTAEFCDCSSLDLKYSISCQNNICSNLEKEEIKNVSN